MLSLVDDGLQCSPAVFVVSLPFCQRYLSLLLRSKEMLSCRTLVVFVIWRGGGGGGGGGERRKDVCVCVCVFVCVCV